MIDQPCRDEPDCPSSPEQCPDHHTRALALHRPQRTLDRVPINKQDCEDGCGGEAEYAAFKRLRNHLGPGLLEALSRHHRVLHAEQRDQPDVDECRSKRRCAGTLVDMRWHEIEPSSKADQIHKADEKCSVACQRNQHNQCTAHCSLPKARDDPGAADSIKRSIARILRATSWFSETKRVARLRERPF